MTVPLTSGSNDTVQAEPAALGDGTAMLRPGSVFIGQNDVRFALDGGFSEDEVAFMLNLGDPLSEANVERESSSQNGKEPPPR